MLLVTRPGSKKLSSEYVARVDGGNRGRTKMHPGQWNDTAGHGQGAVAHTTREPRLLVGDAGAVASGHHSSWQG